MYLKDISFKGDGFDCAVSLDACDGFPCGNGGTCNVMSSMSWCQCADGFSGLKQNILLLRECHTMLLKYTRTFKVFTASITRPCVMTSRALSMVTASQSVRRHTGVFVQILSCRTALDVFMMTSHQVGF